MSKNTASGVLGRNMLSVAKFKKFLDQSKAKYNGGLHADLVAIYERYMKGAVSIEVRVTVVSLSQGLAECTMRARGQIIEEFFAPIDCFTPIKPVVPKNAPVPSIFGELDRLVACAV